MRVLCSIITLLIVMSATAQEKTLYKNEYFSKGKDTLYYRILYPVNYDLNKKYPVILFLHGAGERGSDNEKQLMHGAKLFADSANRAKFPAFVIIPQCPESDFWARIEREPAPGTDTLGGFKFESNEPIGKSLGLVVNLIDLYAKAPYVNTKRIYLGGLSMGGMGTFELLWRKPKFFAAAFPICGGGDPSKVNIYAKNYPVWVFHGNSDPIVPVSNSRLMVKELKKAGATVKYSEYPGVGHDSWTNAFAEPKLLEWIFSQELK